MALDTELMLNEFMHGFGDYTWLLRDAIYDLCKVNKRFDLIPEKIGKTDFRRFYEKNYVEVYSKKKINKKGIDSNIKDIPKAYKVLEGLVNEIAKQNKEYSHCFKLIQTFMKLLRKPISSFEEYLRFSKDETDFQKAFAPYVPQLEVATHSINGIMEIRRIYDDAIDGDRAREIWTKKHPEFTREEWKLKR
jgi:hypothetical protein